MRFRAIALITAVALGGCSDQGPAPAGPGGWQEPDEYVFTVEADCGLRMFSGRYRVHVRNGAVVEYAQLDGRGGPIELRNDQVPTLADMVRRFHEANADPDARATMVTDPVDGHPVVVDIDWMVRAIDDEECYRVSDYDPGVP